MEILSLFLCLLFISCDLLVNFKSDTIDNVVNNILLIMKFGGLIYGDE